VVPEHPADAERLASVLAAMGWKTVAEGGEVTVEAPASQAAEVNRAAAAAGITLRVLRPHEASLEDVFLEMTGARSGDNGRPEASS